LRSPPLFPYNFRTEKIMPRKVKNPKIDSRSAREKLPKRREPYWAKVSKGSFLGYRRIAVSGTWIARYRDHNGKQNYQALGTADDSIEANAKTVLTYEQAQDAARRMFKSVARERDGVKREGPYTVRRAVEDYLRDYEARSGKSTGRMESNINTHILPALGKVDVEKLTRQRIRDWHHGLAVAAPRIRTKEGEDQQYKERGDDPDTARKRKATANRILTILKAALNHAIVEGEAIDPVAWTAVRPFKNVDAPKVRYLSDDESLRLTNACTDDMRQMVTAALLTGGRYGELARLRCGDFDPDSGTLYIATGKSGKPRHIVLTDEGSEFFTQATTGMTKNEIIFKRSTGGPWGNAHQYRLLKEACERAKIIPPASFHILRHSYASRLAMNGVPMKVIAEQLGHADTRITEKHYAHLAESYKADTVRAAFGSLGLVKPGNVNPLKLEKKRGSA
jgi:integrase